MSLVSLFDEGQLDTLLSEESDDWLLAFSNNEAVADSCGKGVVVSILNVGDIEA